MFGSSNSGGGSIFGGGSKDNGSIFGGNSKDNGSIFDKKDDKNNGSIFGGNRGGGSIFDSKKDSKGSVFDALGGPAPSSAFGSSETKGVETSIFGGTNPSDVLNGSGPADVLSGSTKGNTSIFEGNNSQVSAFGGGQESQVSSAFGNNETPSSAFGTDNFSSRTSVEGLTGGVGRHISGKYESRDLGIGEADKYKASYLREDRDLTSLNARGQNYGGMNLLDRMRGEQANHLNNETNSVSMAEQYSDASLDKRAMDGLYNVTLSDIYADKAKFDAHHGLTADGKVDIIDNTYMVDTFSDPKKENTSLWGMDYKLDKTLDFGEAGGPIHDVLMQSDKRDIQGSIFNQPKEGELSSVDKMIAATALEKKQKKEEAKKAKNAAFMAGILGKNKKESKKENVIKKEKDIFSDFNSKSNNSTEKYSKIIEEKRIKKELEKKEKDKLYFEQITNININKDEEGKEGKEERKKEVETFLKEEGIISNQSKKEYSLENNLEKILEKKINNIVIIIAKDSYEKLYIGGEKQYSNNELKEFKLKNNLWFKIDNNLLHIKKLQNNYLCNIDVNLNEKNNIFPFEFLLENEISFLEKKEKKEEKNQKIETVIDLKDRKKAVKNILSKIT